MADARIELALRGIEAWNRGDLDAFMEMWHPDAQWRPAFPEATEGAGSVFQGHEGIRRAWRNVRAAWSVYEVEPRDARIGSDRLLVLGRIHARGITSGVEIDSDWSAVVGFRDGLAVSAWDWLDHEQGLEEFARSGGS
jgi:ketosteroid isomerase-like protein